MRAQTSAAKGIGANSYTNLRSQHIAAFRLRGLLSLCRQDSDSGLATRLNEAQKLLPIIN
jgi:hypothetical protein